MNYFGNLTTVAEIKVHYRRLYMRYHPDRGGNTATMQEINAQYHSALSCCDGQTYRGTDQASHTYHYYAHVEQAVMDKIGEIIALGMDNVDIRLIGHWVWVTGDTRRYARQLGKHGLQLRWHPKRKAWYWHLPSKRKYHFNSHVDLDDLAATYGYQNFESYKRPSIG